MENLCLLRMYENKFITNHLTLTAQSNARQVNSSVSAKNRIETHIQWIFLPLKVLLALRF